LYACRHGCVVADDPLGTLAPDFALPDLAGTTVRRDDFAAAPALLVVFVCNHCPYVRHIEAELSKVLAQCPSLAVVGICTNDIDAYPDDRPERLAEQAQRAGWFFRTWSTTTNRSVVPTTPPARPTSSCTTGSAGWPTAARSTNPRQATASR
jgi:hypothetical protein